MFYKTSRPWEARVPTERNHSGVAGGEGSVKTGFVLFLLPFSCWWENTPWSISLDFFCLAFHLSLSLCRGSSPALVKYCPMSQAARGQVFLPLRAAPLKVVDVGQVDLVSLGLTLTAVGHTVDLHHPVSQSGPVWLLQRCLSQSNCQWTVFWSNFLISWAPEKNVG